MAQRSDARRKVVVLAAMVACFSAILPLMIRNHPRLGMVLVAIEVVLLVYVIVQFGRVMKEKR